MANLGLSQVGDGTTSVIILAGEMLGVAEPHLANQMHPTVIISAYRQALDDILEALKTKISIPVNLDSEEEMIKIVQSCIGTKLVRVDVSPRMSQECLWFDVLFSGPPDKLIISLHSIFQLLGI